MAENPDKREAQRRVDRIHGFRRELDHLARAGVLVLSDEQRGRVEAYLDRTMADLAERFDVDVSDSQKRMSLAMRIASALGGLALCAAVFMFFYRYWGLLATPVQVAVLIAIPILSLVAADLVFRRERTPYYTSLLLIVALAAFIMNLTVLGSIFNIAPTPDAFLAWGALALILAYAYGLRLPLAGGLIALVIFSAAVLTSWSGGFWGLMTERTETFLPAALALTAIPAVLHHNRRPEFAPLYRLIGLFFVFVTLLVLSNQGRLSFLPLSRNTVEGIYQMTGFAAAAAAIWIGIRRGYAESVNLGSAFFAIYLFNRLFVWWWDRLPRYLFFLIIGVIALALLAVFRRLRGKTGSTEAA